MIASLEFISELTINIYKTDGMSYLEVPNAVQVK